MTKKKLKNEKNNVEITEVTFFTTLISLKISFENSRTIQDEI